MSEYLIKFIYLAIFPKIKIKNKNDVLENR